MRLRKEGQECTKAEILQGEEAREGNKAHDETSPDSEDPPLAQQTTPTTSHCMKDPPQETITTPALTSPSQEEDILEKMQCDVCYSGGDLPPCHVCQKQIHIKCAGTPTLAFNGALNRVICTHCLRRETSRDAGPSSEDTSDSSDDTLDSKDDTSAPTSPSQEERTQEKIQM